jgi:hypothetical protein
MWNMYEIIDGYVIHNPPEYPLEKNGIPTFLEGVDRLVWKIRASNGMRQIRYSADGFHPPRNRSEREVVGDKVYVCYSYSADGCEWYECQWENL